MRHNFLIFSVYVLMLTSCSKGQKAAHVENVIPDLLPEKKPLVYGTLENHLGINAFEWSFSESNNSIISPGKMDVIRSFGGFRHYLDWEKIEPEEGRYTFSPTQFGGWDYDMIYAWCKKEGIEILSCLKTCPPWLLNSYPEGKRDAENVPAPYGLDRNLPASYIQQARAGFQFAARYGKNSTVDLSLIKVDTRPRWPGDPGNKVKVGLGYVNYIECDNERDKDWKGPLAHQNAEEYAANMSAFYDGDMGKLGPGVGVKSADPNMKVVMGGLSVSKKEYVLQMIAWCKKNRGYKPDGSVNLCFDVINYHHYNNNDAGTVGKAPELSSAAKVADGYFALANESAGGMEVWLTECGYDINPGSPQRAIAIGNKSALITQADWSLRSVFSNVRHGLKRTFFYMLDDVDPNNGGRFASSGFAVGVQRRPVADYFYQVRKLMGSFKYLENKGIDPIVDIYSENKRKIYVLYIPDEIGRTARYELDLGNATTATIYTLVPGADDMKLEKANTTNGKLTLNVSETPIFVESNIN
ncbi:beta-galactosidase [Pedobacter heparinus]|uniref:Glycoside hydrolase family 42 N-terminal domain-containing protein n=1 Tax=Pedobacter heparinus (strain ATCC 13125 / DSM 2366 / CIP 104194 / JCM 7457 / NBRC 12017 / NCIMB 9290 / NRRL B-14731 / HIM 762-3) TaxID=485917 RepID=C6XW83_PEDHD|nr:beta-galactosidase [Pedobacter heparinus]ACU04162.1 hypothetical protein Phep_1954 [Pedobacter heparinus DSM 2366]